MEAYGILDKTNVEQNSYWVYVKFCHWPKFQANLFQNKSLNANVLKNKIKINAGIKEKSTFYSTIIMRENNKNKINRLLSY